MTNVVTGAQTHTDQLPELDPDQPLDVGAGEPGGSDGDAGTPIYAWAPIEPEPKKRHLAWWLGVPAAIIVIGVVLASIFLIAPGTAVAGTSVGFMTQAGAVAAIEQRLADTTIDIVTPEGTVTVTGAELGATVDAEALAAEAFGDHPLWNVTEWFQQPIEADVAIDATATTATLSAALPALYTAPTDASVGFDEGTASYVVTPAVDGTGIDLEAVRAGLQSAFTNPSGPTEIDVDATATAAAVTTADAESAAATLNGILDTAGFYIGEERTVALDRAQVASWLTVSDIDGTLTLSADANGIQSVVDTLPGLVDRAAVNATVITNSAGDVLRDEVSGQTGRALGDTSGIADAYASQLAAGNAVYQLPVTETAFETTALARTIDVNLSTQTTTLYENGVAVQSYAISSGTDATPTPTGNFTVFAHVRIQDMGCTATSSYCTEDVPWVTYFAPDIAFHGAYWHNNFGQQMSHGCVNMPVDVARYVYEWTAIGTEVSVHY